MDKTINITVHQTLKGTDHSKPDTLLHNMATVVTVSQHPNVRDQEPQTLAWSAGRQAAHFCFSELPHVHSFYTTVIE